MSNENPTPDPNQIPGSDQLGSQWSDVLKNVIDGMNKEDERFREDIRNYQEQLRSTVARMFNYTSAAPQSEELTELITILQEVPALVTPTLTFVKAKMVQIKEAVSGVLSE